MDLQFYTSQLFGSNNYLYCLNATKERIKLLQTIHMIKNEDLTIDKQHEFICQLLEKNNDKIFLKLLNNNGHLTNTKEDMINRRKDHISFLFLIFALHDNENKDIFKWWTANEIYLFKLRSLKLDDVGVVNFIIINDLPYHQMDKKTAELLNHSGLLVYETKLNDGKVDIPPIYIIPVNKVRHLIRKRLIYHYDDTACVPATLVRLELYKFYFDVLKLHWEDSVKYFQLYLKSNVQINNIIDKIKISFGEIVNLEFHYNPFSFIGSTKKICYNLKSSNIDQIAEQHFPPCMLRIHRTLRKNHHLKNASRVQYVLFLKGLGMTYPDVLFYFRNEFIKRIKPKAFDSEYSYYIKHLFGLVGRKKNSQLSSCQSMAKRPSITGDCNGCFFVNSDIEDLYSKISDEDITKEVNESIIKSSQNGNYGRACAKFFVEKHNGCDAPETITHATEYVKMSLSQII